MRFLSHTLSKVSLNISIICCSFLFLMIGSYASAETQSCALLSYETLYDQTVNTQVTSASFKIVDITNGELTITNGEYSINGWPWDTEPTVLNEWDTLQLRHTTSSEPNNDVTTTISLCNKSIDFTSITTDWWPETITPDTNICGGSSIDFTLSGINNDNLLDDSLNLIHFFSGWNDVWGSLILLPLQELETPVTLTLWSQTQTCHKQVQGIYYNNLRGTRLRPLDTQTHNSLVWHDASYADLTVSWGLYMNCSWATSGTGDIYSMYGQVSYEYEGETSSLTFGTKLDIGSNTIIPEFHPNIQLFDNQIPLGYMYDSIGGIWFVWGLFQWDHNDVINNHLQTVGWNVNNTYAYEDNDPATSSIVLAGDNDQYVCNELNPTARDLVRWLVFKGNIGTSQATSDEERQSVAGNISQTNSNLIGSDTVNNATVRNTAIKNAEELCRGKRIKLDDLTTPESQDIICIQENTYKNETWTIDLASDTNIYDVPIIAKNINIQLNNHMWYDNDLAWRPPLQIFIDNGHLFLQGDQDQSKHINIDTAWYPQPSASTTQWIYLEGTIIVNGLILTTNKTNDIQPTEHKRYIHGTVSTLSTPWAVSPWRIKQIQNMFGSYASLVQDHISLADIFTGSCNAFDGKFSDGVPCDSEWDAYYYAPLIIIKKNFTPPSVLLQE